IDAEAHALAFAAVVGREPAWCPPRRRQTDPRFGLELLTGNGIPADAARRLLPTYLPALARAFRGLVAERPSAMPSVPGGALVALRRIAARGGVRQSFLSRRIRANARLVVRAAGLDPFLDHRFGVFAADYGDHRVLLDNALHAIECRHRIRIS